MNEDTTKYGWYTTDSSLMSNDFYINSPSAHFMIITHDGKLIKGEGLSDDEATLKTFEALTKQFCNYRKSVENSVREKMLVHIENIERLLINMQPHIEQSCQIGHTEFIDNYVEAIKMELDVLRGKE